MAEFPYFNLYTDAYLADTRHLSTVEHGAYFLMLMEAWRQPGCNLLDDDVYLAKITGLDLRTWKKHRSTLLGFWHRDTPQTWAQSRLLDERKLAQDKKDNSSKAGIASALKRKNRDAYLRGSQQALPLMQESTPVATTVRTPVQHYQNHIEKASAGGRKVQELSATTGADSPARQDPSEEPPEPRPRDPEIETLRSNMKTFAEHLTGKRWGLPDEEIASRVVEASRGEPIDKICRFMRSEALRKVPKGIGGSEMKSYGFIVKLIQDNYGVKA